MSNVLSLRIPKSLHEEVKELAQDEGVSLNQFVMLALAEKVATLRAIDYLEQRAARGSREKLLALLAKAPDVEPEPYDRLDASGGVPVGAGSSGQGL
jgi:hypothetical protein